MSGVYQFRLMAIASLDGLYNSFFHHLKEP